MAPLAVFLVGGFMFFFTPRKWSVRALQVWGQTSVWWFERIVGTRMEVRGREHIPAQGCIIAGKHQSAWDTFAILPLLNDPAVVMKRELMVIPFYGWFSMKFKMIGIDRTAGAAMFMMDAMTAGSSGMSEGPSFDASLAEALEGAAKKTRESLPR